MVYSFYHHGLVICGDKRVRERRREREGEKEREGGREGERGREGGSEQFCSVKVETM